MLCWKAQPKGLGMPTTNTSSLPNRARVVGKCFSVRGLSVKKYVEEIDAKEHNDFISSIGTNPKMYGDEIELRDHYKLTPEQLKWRRTTIEGDCKGVLSTFRMNYPVSSTEAFGSADAPLFHTPSLDWFKKLIAPPIRTGRMEMVEKGGLRASGNEEFVFVDDNSGAIELWEEPSEFDEYVWASDHAEGLPSKDSNVALIAKRNPFKIVCKIKGNDNTKLQLLEFSRQLTYLLEWFDAHKAYLKPTIRAVPFYHTLKIGVFLIALCGNMKRSETLLRHQIGKVSI